MLGSSRGSADAAQTGSAVPTTSHTSPGENTPAPSVAAISSPQPTATTVVGSSPVASAKDAAIVMGSVAAVHPDHRGAERPADGSAHPHPVELRPERDPLHRRGPLGDPGDHIPDAG